jgi:hypothetical protein
MAMKTLGPRSASASFLVLFLTVSFCFSQGADKTVAEGGVHIGIVGDQYGVTDGTDPYPDLERGLALLKRQHVDVVLHVGDLIEGTGQDPVQYRTRFNHAAEILDRAQIPWYLTPGDHDVNPKSLAANSDDRSIEKLFYENYHPRRPELGPKLFYSFDVGRYHFVALNSLEHLRTDIRWGDVFLAKMTDDQFAWLKKDLADHRSAAGIVIFMHQPLWYNVGAWAPVHRLLREYPVRAVIAGHLHCSEDDGELDGIRYLVVGATGGMLKPSSPEVGGVPVVGNIVIGRTSFTAQILPVDGQAPATFATRRDTDRILALDYAMDAVGDWPWEAVNAVCLINGTLIMPARNNLPAVVQLRAIGNPIDVPTTLALTVEIGSASRQGTFAANICSNLSGQQCVIAPGTNIDMSNVSTVQFRWPELTETSLTQQVAPLGSAWEAAIGDMGTGIAAGSTLHLRLKYSFQGDGGLKYLERDVQSVIKACAP